MTTTVTTEPAVDGSPQAQHILIAGKFLSSVAYFAALPFLTLYLSTVDGLSKPLAGALVGTVALVSAVGGLAAGTSPTALARCA